MHPQLRPPHRTVSNHHQRALAALLALSIGAGLMGCGEAPPAYPPAEYDALAERLCDGQAARVVFGTYTPPDTTFTQPDPFFFEQGTRHVLVTGDCTLWSHSAGWAPPRHATLTTAQLGDLLQKTRALEWADALSPTSADTDPTRTRYTLDGAVFAPDSTRDGSLGAHLKNTTWTSSDATSWTGGALRVWGYPTTPSDTARPWPETLPAPADLGLASQPGPDGMFAYCAGTSTLVTDADLAATLRSLRARLLSATPEARVRLTYQGQEYAIQLRETLPFEGATGLLPALDTTTAWHLDACAAP